MDKKRNIAIFYSNGGNISNGKMDILSFLNDKRLLINKGNSNIYETPKCDIHWINVKKRNIKKFLEAYDIEEIFCIDTKYEDKVMLQDANTYWRYVVIEKVKDIYGGKEIVYIPHYSYAKKYVTKSEVYVLDKHKECFSTEQEAEDYAVTKLKENNKGIVARIESLQEELKRNVAYINKIGPRKTKDN